MHELSIAVSLVELAQEEAQARGGQVTAVYLRVGALSGVVRDALLFSYTVACQGTPLEGSRLEIEDVPVVVYCADCGEQRTLASIQLFRCPQCGAPTGDVRSGKELELVALEIEQ